MRGFPLHTICWVVQNSGEEGFIIGPESMAGALPDRESETERKPLTRREAQVLSLVVDGATNAQIAHGFGLSPETVAVHVTSIRRKLDAPNRTELAAYAIRQGLVSAEDGVRPATIEVEWGHGDQVEDYRFRYLPAETNRRMPATYRAMLDASFAEFQGPGWLASNHSFFSVLREARHTDDSIPYSGVAGRLEETGKDFAWEGSLTRISDTHYLSITENFPDLS